MNIAHAYIAAPPQINDTMALFKKYYSNLLVNYASLIYTVIQTNTEFIYSG